MCRGSVVIACAATLALVCSPIRAVSSPCKARLGKESPDLCAPDRVICVASSVTNSLIHNPFRMVVQVNSADNIYVAWEIKDSTGRVLESDSTYGYANGPIQDFLIHGAWHIQAFIFTPAQSEQGTVTLTPSRYTIQTGGVDLPGITIPIRLTTAKSAVVILEPQNPDDLKGAASDWVQAETHAAFNPKLKLETRRIEIMRFDSAEIIGATAEAVLRAWPGQGPFHVSRWRQSGSTAHVALVADGWAGVTYYGTEVSYLIEKSLLSLPGVKQVIFDRQSLPSF
jgi:hypothetical protein